MEPPEKITKEEYNNIKDNKDSYPKELVSIAGFCATYNAKWFGGYAGIVKTKNGTIRNYYDESIRNIIKQLDLLRDVEFVSGDYSRISKVKKSLIYCDPRIKERLSMTMMDLTMKNSGIGFVK